MVLLSCQLAYRGHLRGEAYTSVWGKGKLGGLTEHCRTKGRPHPTGCSQGPSWQVMVVVILKHVSKSKGQSKTLDVCDRFLHSQPYNQGFLSFSLLWETPQSQMKNLGRECGFPVQSPVTKSVSKVRTRGHGCDDFFYSFSLSQQNFAMLDTKFSYVYHRN